MSEPEVIEAEEIEEPGAELVPVSTEPQPQPPATLFHTDDPVEVVRRATEVANVLARVLREKELTKRIGNKEHVLVEGWTLCGSMLGVFAIPIWTHKLSDPEGWEARVEARTITGAVIGAADAQCTRDEKMWGFEPRGRNGQKLDPRDDFALRSMAQTRASAKALRLPLGFIITLAGFEATPAEEMSTDERPQERRQEGPSSFPVPKSWAKIEEAIYKGSDNPDEAWAIFQAYLRAASYHLFGKTDQVELDKDQRTTLLRKAAGAVCWLMDNHEESFQAPEFYFFTIEFEAKAWAAVLEGTHLEIPDYVAPEPPTPEIDEEALRLARESFADAGNPYP